MRLTNDGGSYTESTTLTWSRFDPGTVVRIVSKPIQDDKSGRAALAQPEEKK